MQAQLWSGARCTLSISGKEIAAAHVMDYSIDTKASEIETIDNVFPAEIAPERIRVSMSLRVYRHPDNDPVVDKIAPGGSTTGTAEQKAFTEALYVSVNILDNYDNTVLHIPKAWVVRRTGSMTSGDILTESWTLLGIGYYGTAA